MKSQNHNCYCCPDSKDLEYLTNKLVNYLTSQGLKVSFLDHCYITISWEKELIKNY